MEPLGDVQEHGAELEVHLNTGCSQTVAQICRELVAVQTTRLGEPGNLRIHLKVGAEDGLDYGHKFIRAGNFKRKKCQTMKVRKFPF